MGEQSYGDLELTRRVDACWKWLPVFVSVAETENIASTAKALHTTSPSISKAIKAVEEAMGKLLFHRTGGRLKLSPDGQALLAVLKPNLRIVRDEIAKTVEPSRSLAIGVTAATEQLLGPLFATLGEKAKTLRLRTALLDPEDAHEALDSDAVHVVVGQSLQVGPAFERALLRELPLAIFSGESHPLATQSKPTLDQIASYPFCVGKRIPRLGHAWPEGTPRIVGLVADTRLLAIEAVRSGAYLTVMEDHPHQLKANPGFVRIDYELGTSIELQIAHRPLSCVTPTVRWAVETLRKAF